MPITEELSAEIAGVVAVVDVGPRGGSGGESSGAAEGERCAVWHVAVTPADPGPRLRGAWVVDLAGDQADGQADGHAGEADEGSGAGGLEPLVRHRPVWPLSARAAEAVGDAASFLVDAEATDAAVAEAVAALDAAFAEGRDAAGAKWVRPDWAVEARLSGAGDEAAGADGAPDPAAGSTSESAAQRTAPESGGPADGDPLSARVLAHARALEELAIDWAASQSLRTSRQGKAGSRDFLLTESLGGPGPAALPLAAR